MDANNYLPTLDDAAGAYIRELRAKGMSVPKVLDTALLLLPTIALYGALPVEGGLLQSLFNMGVRLCGSNVPSEQRMGHAVLSLREWLRKKPAAVYKRRPMRYT